MSTPYSRRSQCGTKRRYLSRDAAKRAAKVSRRINGRDHKLVVYWCGYCESYHFGHRVDADAPTPGAWRANDIPMDYTPPTLPRYLVGIDPGAHTGMAVWDRVEHRLVDVLTLDFWRIITAVTEAYRPDEASLVIEDPNLNGFMYERMTRTGESMAAMMKKAQNVGENKREAALLIEGFRLRGYSVETFRPTRSKPTKEYFEQITGWQGRTSEHARDAAMFVYGR